MERLVGRPVEILLVEDNPGDALLTQEALESGKIKNNLYHVKDGEEALDFLFGRGAYKEIGPRKPDIILLDLNLPKKDGREVLKDVKNDPDLKTIPIVVMTTSTADEDILKCYQLNANCYITKPVSIEQFAKVVGTIEDFWFTIVKLPPKTQ